MAQNPNLLIGKDNLPVTGAAIGIDDLSFTRSQKLIEEGHVNLLFLDTAHAHSLNVIKMLNRVKTWIKNNNHTTEVVLGNISGEEAAKMLINEGADCLKVGQGAGSICTTRIVAGIGVPQWSAVFDVSNYVNQWNEDHPHSFVGVISDGGIR